MYKLEHLKKVRGRREAMLPEAKLDIYWTVVNGTCKITTSLTECKTFATLLQDFIVVLQDFLQDIIARCDLQKACKILKDSCTFLQGVSVWEWLWWQQ